MPRLYAAFFLTILTIGAVVAADEIGNRWDFKTQGAISALSRHDLRVRESASKRSFTIKRAQADYDKELNLARVELQRALTEAMTSATKAGNLDEAVKVREALEAVKNGQINIPQEQPVAKSITLLGPAEDIGQAKMPDHLRPMVLDFDTISTLILHIKDGGGRRFVQTHPHSPEKPALLARTLKLPDATRIQLHTIVSHAVGGDWVLVVKVNGEAVLNKLISQKTVKRNDDQHGWAEYSIDLSRFAGRTIDLELLDNSNDWQTEDALWSLVRIDYE